MGGGRDIRSLVLCVYDGTGYLYPSSGNTAALPSVTNRQRGGTYPGGVYTDRNHPTSILYKKYLLMFFILVCS